MTSDFPEDNLQDLDDGHLSESSPDEFSDHQATFVKNSPELITYQDLYIKGDGEYELRRRSKVSESYEFISQAEIASNGYSEKGSDRNNSTFSCGICYFCRQLCRWLNRLIVPEEELQKEKSQVEDSESAKYAAWLYILIFLHSHESLHSVSLKLKI